MGKTFLFDISGNSASRDAEQKYTKEAAEGRIQPSGTAGGGAPEPCLPILP